MCVNVEGRREELKLFVSRPFAPANGAERSDGNVITAMSYPIAPTAPAGHRTDAQKKRVANVANVAKKIGR